MKTLIAIFLSFLFVATNGYAHADRIIPIKKDGTLEGIPREFGPSTLIIEFARANANGPAINSITLRLGKNRILLPSCITNLLKSRSTSQIKASASWYHNEKTIPYYLNLEFGDPGFEDSPDLRSHYSMLFNLRTGMLMQMERVSNTKGEGSIINYKTVRIDVASLCGSESLDSFSSLSELRP
ncbi:MAG TPA: hypothetical protein VJ505_11560 [Holophagaceae bacterium]|nr:hypothetical protein [Holophagaceae bacterium]